MTAIQLLRELLCCNIVAVCLFPLTSAENREAVQKVSTDSNILQHEKFWSMHILKHLKSIPVGPNPWTRGELEDGGEALIGIMVPRLHRASSGMSFHSGH